MIGSGDEKAVQQLMRETLAQQVEEEAVERHMARVTSYLLACLQI